MISTLQMRKLWLKEVRKLVWWLSYWVAEPVRELTAWTQTLNNLHFTPHPPTRDFVTIKWENINQVPAWHPAQAQWMAAIVVISDEAPADPATFTGINQNKEFCLSIKLRYQLFLVAFPDNFMPPTFGENEVLPCLFAKHYINYLYTAKPLREVLVTLSPYFRESTEE